MAYTEEEICELCDICNLTGNDYYNALMDCLVNYSSPDEDKELYITNLSPKFKGTKYDPRIEENDIGIRGYTEEEYMELFPYVEKAIPGKPRIIDNYTDRLR